MARKRPLFLRELQSLLAIAQGLEHIKFGEGRLKSHLYKPSPPTRTSNKTSESGFSLCSGEFIRPSIFADNKTREGGFSLCRCEFIRPHIFAVSITLCSLANINPAIAQIIPDRTLGEESSVLTPNADINNTPADRIDGGAIRGANLFHSFQEFNIREGQRAYFSNPSGIENIMTRVTGGNPSNILGTLGVLGNANLFLLNPNGIIFGANASLNMGGSFLASTADSIQLADGSSFSAGNPSATPLLTISIPIGLQFGRTPGRILVQGQNQNRSEVFPKIPLIIGAQEATELAKVFTQNILSRPVGLQVTPGKTLAIVGGEIEIEGGNLNAAQGRIELGSVAGNSLVSLTPTARSLTLGYENVQNFQPIKISRQATVNTSGVGGGEIRVWGGKITIGEQSAVVASTLGGQNGEGLDIRAEEIIIGRNSIVGTGTIGLGNAGNVNIETGSLTIQDQGFLENGTIGQGNAGETTIRARDFVNVVNNGFIITSAAFTGIGGNILIETPRLSLRDGGEISAATVDSPGGSVRVIAPELVEVVEFDSDLSTETRGGGTSGDVTIVTGRLIVQNGGTVSTASRGAGAGGTLTINALESVEVTGKSANGKFPSGLFASSGLEGYPEQATGSAGSLRIGTGRLIVGDGAIVAVESRGSGDAGDLAIAADSIRLDNGGSLNAATVSGEGGNIRLRVRDLQQRRGSNITTDAGNTDGGNITIETDTLVALENSDITANARRGSGGRVSIDASGIFGTSFRENEDSATSDITATSELGAQFSGSVEIKTPDVDPSRGLATLPAEVVDRAAIIAQNPCEQSDGSEFTITGRGGLPSNPNDALASDLVRVGLVDPAPAVGAGSPRPAPVVGAGSPRPAPPIANSIVPARGWIFNYKGEVVLTAYNPRGTEPQRQRRSPPTCDAP